jgi:small subunit ribosomal protein S17
MSEHVKQAAKKVFQGEVVSAKMDKTVVVKVERSYIHPHLHKVMRVTKKYKVHDELKQAVAGDVVEFYEGRPVSKTKYMYLGKIISSRLQR